MRHTPTSERSAVVHPLVPQKSMGPIPYLLFYKRHMEGFSQNVLCARCVHTLLHHFHPEVFWSIFSITICKPKPTEKSYYGNICTDYMLWTFPIGLQILMHNTRGLCWCVAPRLVLFHTSKFGYILASISNAWTPQQFLLKRACIKISIWFYGDPSLVYQNHRGTWVLLRETRLWL